MPAFIPHSSCFVKKIGGPQGSRTPVLNLLPADLKHAYSQSGRPVKDTSTTRSLRLRGPFLPALELARSGRLFTRQRLVAQAGIEPATQAYETREIPFLHRAGATFTFRRIPCQVNCPPPR